MKTPVPESLFNKFAQNTSATGCFCDFLKYNKHFKMNHKDRKKHKKKTQAILKCAYKCAILKCAYLYDLSVTSEFFPSYQ